MTISLESLGQQASYVRGQYKEPAGGQERWLFELETAMLAQGVKKNSQHAIPDATEQVSESRAPDVAAQKMVELIDPVAKAVLAGAAETKDLSGTYAVPAQGGWEAGAMLAVSSPIMYGFQRVGVQAGTVAAMDSAYSGSLEVQQVAQLSMGMLTTNPGVSNAAIQPTELYQEAEAVLSQLSQAALEDTHDLSLRKIHFYYDAEGVHAWIRDAALSMAHGTMVAHAMVRELRGAGAHLAALTVNGKELQIARKTQYDGELYTDELAFPDDAAHQLMTKDAI